MSVPSEPRHIPVLHADDPEQSTVLRLLQPKTGETVLDATLGLGGHAAAFLEATSPGGTLIGVDADADNLALATERLRPWAERVRTIHCNFGELVGIPALQADIVFADLGVSSVHLDDPTRGFTFRAVAPLDLRYDRSHGDTAAAFLCSASENEIARALREYGEIPQSRRLATLLHESFQPADGPSLLQGTTEDVRRCAEQAFGYRAARFLPQVFQALRIQVNDELGALRRLLDLLPSILRPGGRCGIISYHSLEDRMVKHAFRALSTAEKDPRTGAVSREAPFELRTRKSIVPSSEEIARNPRARSARFRVLARRSGEMI